MRLALRAEATKLWTVPSSRWLLGGVVGCLAGLGAALTTTLEIASCRSGTSCSIDPTKASLGGVWLAQVAVVVLAVLLVSAEYDTRLVRVTLAAMPRRLTVLAAKAGVVSTVAVVSGAIGTAGALLAARVILGHNGFTSATGYPSLSLGDDATRRAAAGTVIYLALVALLAMGVAACLRDTAGTLVTVLALLYLFPMLGLVVNDPTWHQRIERFAPMSAGLSVQTTRDLDQLAIGPWAGLGVLAAYATTALIAGAVVFATRDA